MDLDDGTRDELAGFLARRFPSAEARAGIARAAGISPAESATDAREAWRGILDAAGRARALPRLAAAARAAAPEDRNLAEACALLSPAPAARGPLPLIAGLGALLVVAGGGAWLASSGPNEDVEPPAAAAGAAVEASVAPEARPPAPEAAPAAALPPAPAKASVADAPAAGAAPAADAAVAAAVPPAPAKAPVDPEAPKPPKAPAAPEASPPAAPTPSAATASDPTVPARCLGAPGTVVGWWYAGTTSPGARGSTIRLAGSVNVRDGYPREENGYSRRSTVLCSLSVGTRQRLSLAPIDIGRGQWWVPVAGGDL